MKLTEILTGPDRWIQQHLYGIFDPTAPLRHHVVDEEDRGRANCFCMLGAISEATGNEAYGYQTTETTPEMFEAIFSIVGVLFKRTDEQLSNQLNHSLSWIEGYRRFYNRTVVSRDSGLSGYTYQDDLKIFLITWNDALRTTWEDIKTVIEEAGV